MESQCSVIRKRIKWHYQNDDNNPQRKIFYGEEYHTVADPGFPRGGGANSPGGGGGANIQFCQISPKTA